MPDLKRIFQGVNPRKSLVIAFQTVVILFALVGVGILVAISRTVHDALNMFTFYTIQSNLLAAAALGLSLHALVKNREDLVWLIVFKSGTVLWILVTGIVYHLLLAGRWNPTGLTAFASLALHSLTPAGMVLNWLVFEKKGRYRFIFTLYWLSYPFLYMLFSWARGVLTGNFNYWFLNPSLPYPEGAGSLGAMLVIVAGLVLGFSLLGVLIILVDKLLARGQHHPFHQGWQ